MDWQARNDGLNQAASHLQLRAEQVNLCGAECDAATGAGGEADCAAAGAGGFQQSARLQTSGLHALILRSHLNASPTLLQQDAM